MKGGGWGFTGASSIPGVPGTVSNPQVFTGIGDCRATEPGYWIPQSSYGTYQKGLPGMSGGRRRKTYRKQRGGSLVTTGQRGGSLVTTGQRGGRYTFDLSAPAVAGVAPNAAAWWAGSYPPVQRIACEGSTPNPLNPGPHTPSTQPTPVASSNLHLNPQSGGSAPLGGTVGVGNVDSMYYYGPTAGYDNKPSTWVDSVGAPVQLQIPFAARQMNPSCVTTGHPPPLTGALQKGGGIWNTMKNSLKKVTNTVGITKRNNMGMNMSQPTVNLARLGNAYATTNTALPINNTFNPTSVTNYEANNITYASRNNNNSYGNNTNSYTSGFEDSVSGGKRKRRSNKKSRKGRRKH